MSAARLHRLARCTAAGLLVSASVPPFGWWPLALVGIAWFSSTVHHVGSRRGIAVGSFALGLGTYLPSLWWMTAFSLPGGIVVAGLQAAITSVAITVATARTRAGTGRRDLGVVVGIALAEVLRAQWPFGGLPLGGIDLGQAAGPIAPVAAWGGRFLVVLLTAALAVVAGRIAVRRGSRRVIAAAGLLLVVAVAHVAPDGTQDGPVRRLAVVQGGGPRGERNSPSAAERTFAAHRAATDRLSLTDGSIDLVVWPEDVIDVDRFVGSPEERVVRSEANRLGAPFVVGIVEDGAPGRFRNAAVVVPPDDERLLRRAGRDRFDKVRRVPYGEWFPFRSTIEGLGLADLPARDAEPGTGPGVLDTTAGRLAVAISYEAFFPDRARSGVRAGGRLLLVPTNASSYTTAQVPTQQLAAARLRAHETGRWVVQAAPTGLSVVLDPSGRVVARTDLGPAAVLRVEVVLRSGLTPFARFGDAPLLVLLALALAALLLRPSDPEQPLGSFRRDH